MKSLVIAQPPHTPAAVFERPGAGHGYLLALLAACLLLLSACDQQNQASNAAAPPPAVVAISAATQPVEDQEQFVGRVVAVDKVELRARVQGFLKARKFTEGQQVTVGDELFVIEPDQYEAVIQQRKANVAKAEADTENADAQYRRGRELLKSKAIAQSKVDELKAAALVAEAGIAQAKAALVAAELDLGYTKVVAPVAGRIGLSEYTVGNLVGPSSEPLATIVSTDPIYVEFPLTQRQLLEARKRIKTKGADPEDLVVRVNLADDSLYEQPGRLNFIDVTTDPGTDTVTVRAELPNPDGLLVDGQFARVTVETGKPESAIVIPQSALQVDQQGIFVLIVDEENKAQVRRIETGATVGANVVVLSGLKEGELVITDGIQKVRPGQVVNATPPQNAGAVEGDRSK